jgi:isopenicillin N synthase-like dioxygenase
MSTSPPTDALPVVDIASLNRSDADFGRIATELDHACAEFGFFYVTGHGVDPSLVLALQKLAQQFFALPVEEKLEIAMARGGRAWRGYFPLGGELTSGRPDRKEGIYFGTELGPDDPRVQADLPLHGMNLYPARRAPTLPDPALPDAARPDTAGPNPTQPDFREVLLTYLESVTALGQRLLAAIAYGLGLHRDYFLDRYTRDPTVLFRIFNYPPAHVPAAPSAGAHTAKDVRAGAHPAEDFGVGAHTDYGLLTLLRQDDIGGLEVWHRGGWLAAPPIPDSFVCNVGDMLDRLTAGRYVSALHRVCNDSSQTRISMPLFLDPGFDAILEPIPTAPGLRPAGVGSAAWRWDGTDLATLSGTYGDYLLGKVAKVFPELGRRHLR